MKNSANGRIRFGIVGCGAIADKHALAISRLENAEVAGAFDINPDARAAFTDRYAVPAFARVEEMIEKTEPDVLSILTPSGNHAETLTELMRFNRHFVVEKPLALRLDHVDTILEQCDRRRLKVFVVQQNRFNPPIQKLKEAITTERFGRLVLGTVRVRWCRDEAYYSCKPWRGTWAHDGGVLSNQGSHHIDMLIWLMGDVVSVMAKTATHLAPIEAEDTGIAILKFRSGALGIIEATTAARPSDLEGSISVLGEKGAVEVGGFFMNELKTWNFTEPIDSDAEVISIHGRVPDLRAWNHTEFYRDVISSVINNEKGLIDGLEGRKSVELLNALYESAEIGKEVFLRFTPRNSRLGRAL